MALVEYLEVAEQLTKLIESETGVSQSKAASIVNMVVEAIIAFAKQGKDPVLEIKRILSADPELAHLHDAWEAKLAEKFGTEP